MSDEILAWLCLYCGATTRGASVNRAMCGRCRHPKEGTVVPEGEERAIPKRMAFMPRIAQMRAFSNRADWHPLLKELGEGILADIRAENQKPLPKPKLRASDDKHLLEIAPVDLHMGKLAWREETGSDYDISIAEQVFTEGIEDTLANAGRYAIDGIVLVVGNDLLQSDNEQSETTGGTYVDTDSRYVKSFRRARQINSWAIKRCAEIAPTRVVIIPGNHDSLTAFHLGEVLEAEFSAQKHIEVDNRPKRRKYLRYGVNLLGWTHGSEEKHQDLPLIMAQECPEDWAQTKHREWHIGHLHRAKEMRFTAGDSFNGVRVRILPSLCAPDAWHFGRGFVHERRACESYVWSKTRGYVGHFSANAREAEVA